MTMIPPETSISLHPRKVEYRSFTGLGTRVVSIEFLGRDPRITSWSEQHTTLSGGKTEVRVLPLMLFYSELQLYVVDAATRLRVKPPASAVIANATLVVAKAAPSGSAPRNRDCGHDGEKES